VPSGPAVFIQEPAPAELVAPLGVEQRAATPADALSPQLAGENLWMLSSLQAVSVPGIRLLRSTPRDGSYYLVPGRVRPTDAPSARCAPHLTAGQRRRLRREHDRDVRLPWALCVAAVVSERESWVGCGPRTASDLTNGDLAFAAGSGDASSWFMLTGVATISRVKRPTDWRLRFAYYALVPDGVAEVDVAFRDRVVVAPVQNNFFVFHRRSRLLGRDAPRSMTWKDAAGAAIRSFP
jgi:hypothetical protein